MSTTSNTPFHSFSALRVNSSTRCFVPSMRQYRVTLRVDGRVPSALSLSSQIFSYGTSIGTAVYSSTPSASAAFTSGPAASISSYSAANATLVVLFSLTSAVALLPVCMLPPLTLWLTVTSTPSMLLSFSVTVYLPSSSVVMFREYVPFPVLLKSASVSEAELELSDPFFFR